MSARKYLYLCFAVLGLLVAQLSLAQQRVLPRGVPNVPSLPVSGADDIAAEPRALWQVMASRKDVFPDVADPLPTIMEMFRLRPFTPVYHPRTKAAVQFGGYADNTSPRFLLVYFGAKEGAHLEPSTRSTFATFDGLVAAIKALGPDDKLLMRVTIGEDAKFVRAPSRHPLNSTYDRQYLTFSSGAISPRGVITGTMPVLGDDLKASKAFIYPLDTFRDSYVLRTTEYVRDYGNRYEIDTVILHLPPKKETKAAPPPAEPGA